jgi:ectoine hydroxylase-related dioxygenase (phytanoyl-CoA dioxygenase family)
MTAPRIAPANATLATEGYVVLRNLLDAARVRELADAIRPFLDVTPHGRSDFEGLKTRRVYNLVAKCPAVHPLVEHPVVLELAARHLGQPGFQLSIAQAVEILPGESAQQLHTDDLPFPIPKPHQPVVLNTMWALTEVTPENGATRLVPGSQSASRPPPEDECVSAQLNPGSVLVWDGSIWHGGGANSTDQSRLGLTINYNASWLRQQENQYLSVPREQVDAMSETLRKLIGYDMCGVLGSADGRHPLRASAGSVTYAPEG